MFNLYKLILSWHDWYEPEPDAPIIDGSGIENAGWFIFIFCGVLFLLSHKDKGNY